MTNADLQMATISIINAASIYAATMYGYVWLLLPFLLLSISSFIVFFGSAMLLSSIAVNNKIEPAYDVDQQPSVTIQVMAQCISCIVIYTIYSFGFVFASGIFTSLMIISILNTICKLFRKRKTEI